jgi:formylglycine-generating enzyme required for sulfatase activity
LNLEVGDLVVGFASRDAGQKQAVVLALGSMDETRFPQGEREKLIDELNLETLYRDDIDAGLHAAIRWTLSRWPRESRVRQLDEEMSNVQHGGRNWYVNSQGQTMVLLGPAEFWMGSPDTEPDRIAAEAPRQQFKIDRRFALSMHEVTIEQFAKSGIALPPKNLLQTGSVKLPIHAVTWHQAAEYCNWLSRQDGVSDEQLCYDGAKGGQFTAAADALQRTGYRLPIEAEWEYACRAGSDAPWSFGYTVDLLPQYAWFPATSPRGLKSVVGLKRPNDFGFFDMYGNADEWCHEEYSEGLRKPARALRPIRGKAAGDTPVPRSAFRQPAPWEMAQVAIGFRVARTIDVSESRMAAQP